MHKKTDILKDHVPSPLEITEYEQKWNTLADYVNQENALNKLFFNLCPENKEMSDILIKCSSLNDFYSTNQCCPKRFSIKTKKGSKAKVE